MSIGTNINDIEWNKVSFDLVAGDAVEILPANENRVGLTISLDCEVLDTCIVIKDEDNEDDLGIKLYREGVGVAVFAILEYTMRAENLNRKALYAWKHSGADVTIYVTEYISVT